VGCGCGLRRSTIDATFRLQYQDKEKLGISHYLAKKCELEDVIYTTDLRRAFYVPVGYAVNNSLALLNSPRFSMLLDQISPNVDYIIVDAPPVGMIVDAVEIAKSCDGALLAASYNQVRRKDLLDARQQIEKTGCDVLGVARSTTFRSRCITARIIRTRLLQRLLFTVCEI
jgi:capsular exopolysaccharide synthesis family protein